MMEPNRFNQDIIQELTQTGYVIDEERAPVIGKVEVILVLPDNSLEGGADPRGDDKAMGY